MKSKNVKCMIKRLMAAAMVLAMVSTTDMGMVYAQEQAPHAAALQSDTEEVAEAVTPMEDPKESTEMPAAVEDKKESDKKEKAVTDQKESDKKETTVIDQKESGEKETSVDNQEESVETVTSAEEQITDQVEVVTEVEEERTFAKAVEDPCANGHTPYETVKKATLTTDGSITKNCSVCQAKLSTKKIPHPVDFHLSAKTFTYSGKEKRPTVTVTSASGTIDPANYYVTYENNIKVGTATAKVVFHGTRYRGSTELTFKIRPKATEITSLTPYMTGKGLTVKWAKVASQVTGYQIQYATTSTFTSPVSINVDGNSKFTYYVKGLVHGKRYYVRVRVYKTVDAKKYYSAWSPSKYVRTYSDDEITAWTVVKNVFINGKALNYSAMNQYVSGTSYLPYTVSEKIFYGIFSEENKTSYSYKLISMKTVSDTSITVKVEINSMNYSDAVAQGYLDMYKDVQASGNDSVLNIYRCLKKYTLEEAAGKYPPFKSKCTADITIVKKNGVWMAKSVPSSIRKTFTDYAEVGLSYAEHKLLEY